MENLTFEGLKVNQDEKLCYVDEKPIKLTRIEFVLLSYLMEHKDKVFSREDLLEEIWKNRATIRAVDVAVSRIRAKIGDYKKFIQTRPGFGYAFMTNNAE